MPGFYDVAFGCFGLEGGVFVRDPPWVGAGVFLKLFGTLEWVQLGAGFGED